MTAKAVLLDSFGTLVAMEPPGPHLRDELAKLGFDVDLSAAEAAFGAEIAYYLDHHVEGRDREALEALRDRCAQVVSDSLGNPPVDVRAAMLAAIRFDAFPDAAPALHELRARGLRLVVASNWDCSLGQVLRRAGLRDLVDGVVTSAEAGAAKPDPRLFRAALEVAGCSAAESVYVGDSSEHDIGGATGVGMRAVLIDRSGQAADGISSLSQLPSLLFS